jgi:hypothetical protein
MAPPFKGTNLGNELPNQIATAILIEAELMHTFDEKLT